MAEISTQDFEQLSASVKKKLEQYISDRAELEQQWVKNLRQHRGVYDPDILERIPQNKSKAYPRATRTKIKGFVAKMMEMMFPAKDVNWDLVNTPFPTLPGSVLDEVLEELMQENGRGAEIPDRKIEQAIKKEADKRRERMRKRIEDQLMHPQTDWPAIVKRVVRSGAIYGAGFVRAPMVRTEQDRTWEFDEEQGTYVSVEQKERYPYPEFVKVWDIYPDLSADTWSQQEGIFERMVFSRKTLRDLRNREGFNVDEINSYLRDNPQGNYTVRSFEQSLNTMNKSSADDKHQKERRYEVFRWLGYCSGHDLRSAGVDITDEQLSEGYLADMWLLDDRLIFADKAAFGEVPSDQYHAYIYAEDEESGLTGVGMPEELRDRQMSICSATRALYDNMAASAGPIYEVAVDLLKHGRRPENLVSFSILEREGDDATLAYPAVRKIQTDSHVDELLPILQREQEQMDIESSLPSWMLGNAQPLGEAFRTSSNMSQMTSGGNMVTKDHVRTFDRFTSSVVSAFLEWNMEFSDDLDSKGDYQVRAKGVESLVAKEVRGAALDQFMTTLTDRERVIMRTQPSVKERLRSRDLPDDLVADEDEAQRILERYDQMQEKRANIEQGLTVAKTEESKSKAQTGAVEARRSESMFELDVARAVAEIQRIVTDAKVREDQTQLAMLDKALQGLAEETDAEGGEDVSAEREGN